MYAYIIFSMNIMYFFPGVIGKITLQIPFYRPHSDPWVICMSQLNLIIGPALPQEYDEVQEREAEREQKKQLLKALEDKWKVHAARKYQHSLIAFTGVIYMNASH